MVRYLISEYAIVDKRFLFDVKLLHTQVRNVLGVKTLAYKIISCIFTVISGLPVGFEGPMVHIFLFNIRAINLYYGSL